MEYKSQKDLTGLRFGHWLVLRRSDRPHYWLCRCDCGLEKDVYYASLLGDKSHGCLACTRPPKNPSTSKANLKKAKQKEGQTINGWKVLEILPEAKNQHRLCRAICPRCGKPASVKLSRLRLIDHCAECNRDISKKADIIHATAYADGSSLLSIRARAGGRVNKNSSTGANGISRLPNGRYRAYINFRRKQYGLGSYDTIEEAAAARKAAEELIYAPYLKEHEGWENELAEKLAELKKNKK